MSGQVWVPDFLGGFMYSDQLSTVLRTAIQPLMRFRGLCDAEDGTQKELQAGQEFTWDVYSDVETRGGELNEREDMPETRYRITQGRLVVTEYGNSVPYTGKLDNLSLHPVKKLVNKTLKNDCVKTLDGAAFNQFNLTNLRVVPLSGNSDSAIKVYEDGSAMTETNNIALLRAHVKLISDELKERDIPAYEGADYMCVARPSTFRTFKDEVEDVHKYVESGVTLIRKGEIGRMENTRFVEQTHIKAGASEDAMAAGWKFFTKTPWTNSKSDWAFFMGEDTVTEAILIPEEMRGKIPTGYGRDKGVAWYYLGGFGIVHGPNGNVEQQRIMKWSSKA